MLHAVLEVFVWLLGLCVGSFLNVVVYRLPLGLSVTRPRRSFCPHCRASLAWFDNIPLLSWFVLRGRCRQCRAPIAVQYPLVEGLTGLSFVLVYHLLFVVQARTQLTSAAVPADAPLLLAWLALTAGLVACAAMDIVSYSIDVRVTNAVLVAGVLCCVVWPRHEFVLPTASGSVAPAALAAFIVAGLMLWWSARTEVNDEATAVPETQPDASEFAAGHRGGAAGALLTLAVVGALIYSAASGVAIVGVAAATAGLALTFGVMVLAGGLQRPADVEIHDAIEAEQPQARRTALRELLWLAPAILAGVAVWFAVRDVAAVAAFWRRLTDWSIGGCAPVAGLAYAVHGGVIAAAAGWTLRIVFTLGFGREAFGTGDIYILAAAGAAAGWDIALLGLLLSVGIALAGWLLGLLLKSTAMIPFGPWLALGMVLALWWSRPAARIAAGYRDNVMVLVQTQPTALPLMLGLLLVATAVAMVLARLARRWLAPE